MVICLHPYLAHTQLLLALHMVGHAINEFDLPRLLVMDHQCGTITLTRGLAYQLRPGTSLCLRLCPIVEDRYLDTTLARGRAGLEVGGRSQTQF